MNARSSDVVAVAPLAKPVPTQGELRLVRVWFQHRETGDTSVGRISYRNPQLDDSLIAALFACWDAAPDPNNLDFILATDGEGRAVVTQKALYTYALQTVNKAAEDYAGQVRSGS